jgi:hypothetical protein
MTALACTPAARNCVSMMRRFCIDGRPRQYAFSFGGEPHESLTPLDDENS